MTRAGVPDGARYRAFISYSHKDAVFAKRLHRRLEGYVLPKTFGGSRRLTPIFKDREELPAAHDLSAQVRAALERSDCLIVVCSPDAAASKWVGREIETFRHLHPEQPILVALVRGEPAEAIPKSLAAPDTEPLAADFRKDGDGERLALLKLAAGLAGVGVDQLVQRDAQRQLQRVITLTAAALLGTLVMAAMTAVALDARTEAEAQRLEAEALVEFMLTELREELKGAGDLRVRTVANQRALKYFSKQRPSSLPPPALLQRARLLHAIGEDELDRGKVDSAQSFFKHSYGLTRELLNRRPNDPDRIWTHAQSAYWQGRVAHTRKRFDLAELAWREYQRLARKLNDVQPNARRSLLEAAYAENTLCALAVETAADANGSIRLCQSAVAKMKRAALLSPDKPAVLFDLATDHAWLADAYVVAGDFSAARKHRIQQIEIIESLKFIDHSNAIYLDSHGSSLRALSKISYLENDFSSSEKHMLGAREIYAALVSLDPANSNWRSQLEFSNRALALISSKKTEIKK